MFCWNKSFLLLLTGFFSCLLPFQLVLLCFVVGSCSNASDALDKLRFLSVTDPSLMDLNPNLEIRIKTDPDAGTITIMWAPEIKLSVSTLSLLASLNLGSAGGLRAINLTFLMMWTVAAEGIPSCFWGFSFFLVHMKFYVMILTGVVVLLTRDTGIGMTREELIESLGTIAQSGTAKFMQALKVSLEETSPNTSTESY